MGRYVGAPWKETKYALEKDKHWAYVKWFTLSSLLRMFAIMLSDTVSNLIVLVHVCLLLGVRIWS